MEKSLPSLKKKAVFLHRSHFKTLISLTPPTIVFLFRYFIFFMVATVYIVIYSLYGHVYTLAQEVQKGLEASGVQTKLFQGRFYPVFQTISACILKYDV